MLLLAFRQKQGHRHNARSNPFSYEHKINYLSTSLPSFLLFLFETRGTSSTSYPHVQWIESGQDEKVQHSSKEQKERTEYI